MYSDLYNRVILILIQKKIALIICTYATIYLLKVCNLFLHHLQICCQVVLPNESYKLVIKPAQLTLADSCSS